MKKIFLILPIILLASCTVGVNPNNNTGSTMSGTDNSGSIATVTPNNTDTAGNVYTVNYTLRDGSASGKIIETTVEQVAKDNGLYTEGGKYEPIKVRVGMDPNAQSEGMNVIPGFEEGLKGLKVGDKKGITIPPEKAYGKDPVKRSVPRHQVEPQYTMKESKGKLTDKIQETIDKKDIPENILKELEGKKDGDTITNNNIQAKIVKMTDKNVTFEFDNIQSPFYGKELKVGMKGSDGVNDYTIKNIDGDTVELLVENKQSPFAGKEFKVGTQVDQGGNTLTIEEINDQTVVISQATPMTGKTLYFDIDVVDIK